MSNSKLTFDALPEAVEALSENINTLIKLVTTMDERIAKIEASADSSSLPLDIEQASELIKLTKGTIYKMTCNKELPFHKKGNRLLFYKEELLAWLESGHKSEPQPKTTAINCKSSKIVSTIIETAPSDPYTRLCQKNITPKK